MKIHLFLLAGILLVPVLVNTTKDATAQPNYVACGGHLSENIGSISYKVDYSISAQERCVWSIRSRFASSYTLEVVLFGLQTALGTTGIKATCLSETTTVVSDTPITGLGIVNLDSYCPLLVLTYYSGENVTNSSGFFIVYQEIIGLSSLSPDSKHYIITNPEGYIRHPPNVESEYTNNELSTFVFAPPENIQHPGNTVLVTYMKDGLEHDSCFDIIRIYRFNPSLGWMHGGTSGEDYICGNVTYKFWTSDDLLMFHFKTDSGITNRGFHFTYSNLPVK